MKKYNCWIRTNKKQRDLVVSFVNHLCIDDDSAVYFFTKHLGLDAAIEIYCCNGAGNGEDKESLVYRSNAADVVLGISKQLSLFV